MAQRIGGLNLHDTDANELLFLAAEFGLSSVVKDLLRRGAKVDGADRCLMTPLVIACQNDHHHVVAELLNYGADVNRECTVGYYTKSTALHIAALHGSTTVIQLLLNNKAEINQPSGNGDTPIILALSKLHFKVVKVLKENGAEIDFPDTNGTTPLQHAVLSNDIQFCKLLVEYGADVDRCYKQHTSPKMLLPGADVSMTALHLAIYKGNAELVELFLYKGADLEKSWYGYASLAFAILKGNLGIVRLLVAANADLGGMSRFSPLYVALEHGDIDFVRLLVRNGIPIPDLWWMNQKALPSPIDEDYRSRNANLSEIGETIHPFPVGDDCLKELDQAATNPPKLLFSSRNMVRRMVSRHIAQIVSKLCPPTEKLLIQRQLGLPNTVFEYIFGFL